MNADILPGGWLNKAMRLFSIAAVCLLGLELLLQLACWTDVNINSFIEPRARPTDVPGRVGDPHLISRPNPAFSGHDFRGWRNVGVQDQFDMVALGNSQTYGNGVALQHAWPQQLEFLSGQHVYNLSWGGYTVLDQVCLLEETLALRPQTLLVAFYPPDVHGCYHRVYIKGILRRFKEGRNDPLRFIMEQGRLPSLEERAKQVLELQPRAQLTQRVQEAIPTDIPYRKPAYREGRIPVAYRWTRPKLPRVLPATNQYLLEHWRAYYRWHYRVTGHVNELLPDEYLGEKRKPFKTVPVIEGPFAEQVSKHLRFSRIFQVARRSAVTNLLNPCLAEGYRICEEAFAEIKERAGAWDIRVVAILIPTKELAFRRFLEERCSVSLPPDYLVQNARERLVLGMLHRYLVTIGIEVIDVLPALESCLEQDVLPYSWDRDGHPNPAGYQAMARLIHQRLKAPQEANLRPPEFRRDELFAEAYPKDGSVTPATEAKPRLRLLAQLETLHPLPTVQSTLPYTRALTVQIYRIHDVLEGQESSRRIAVASWAVFDGKPVERVWSLERQVELELVLLELETAVNQERIEDHTEEYELPVYYDTGSLPPGAEV